MLIKDKNGLYIKDECCFVTYNLWHTLLAKSILHLVLSTRTLSLKIVFLNFQDVSRALEASLMESQLGVGNRKRVDNWVDPLNPHERERDGVVRESPLSVKYHLLFLSSKQKLLLCIERELSKY